MGLKKREETELTTIVKLTIIVSLGNWNPTENCLLTTYHSSLVVVVCWWVLVHHGPRTPTHYATAIHLVKILVEGFYVHLLTIFSTHFEGTCFN
jgi:hypothetical protein